jgi:hypothetical protein
LRSISEFTFLHAQLALQASLSFFNGHGNHRIFEVFFWYGVISAESQMINSSYTIRLVSIITSKGIVVLSKKKNSNVKNIAKGLGGKALAL